MDAVYPSSASALGRGRRLRRHEPRARHRTMPVTFAEIKEVDEESEQSERCASSEERRRRPDVLEERLSRQWAEFRRRRARHQPLRELSPPPAAAPAPAPLQRADSLPADVSEDTRQRGHQHTPTTNDEPH